MPAIGAGSFYEVALRDATSEIGRVRFATVDLTAGNFAAQVGLQGALQDAIDGVTLGVIARDQFGVANVISNAIPTDNAAQREMKLLVQMQGATTEQPFIVTIPTVDPAVLEFVPGAGDAVPLDASAEIIALVTAIEAVARNPNNDSEAAEVVGLRFVGRNT